MKDRLKKALKKFLDKPLSIPAIALLAGVICIGPVLFGIDDMYGVSTWIGNKLWEQIPPLTTLLPYGHTLGSFYLMCGCILIGILVILNMRK